MNRDTPVFGPLTYGEWIDRWRLGMDAVPRFPATPEFLAAVSGNTPVAPPPDIGDTGMAAPDPVGVLQERVSPAFTTEDLNSLEW